MDVSRGFIFSDNYNQAQMPNCFVGFVPTGIYEAEHLLSTVAQVLRFPGYFGMNWNALSDCLRDFHWLDEKHVVLVHQDLPALLEADLAHYLDVLRDASTDWADGEEHEFVVVFPTATETAVNAL